MSVDIIVYKYRCNVRSSSPTHGHNPAAQNSQPITRPATPTTPAPATWTLPAALEGVALALAEAPLAAAWALDARAVVLWLADAREGPDAEDVMDAEEPDEPDAAPVALAVELALEPELELDAAAVGPAARLADPPPMVEKVVHWLVGPGGCGAGVDGSPWEKVDPLYTPGCSAGLPWQSSNPGSAVPGMVKLQPRVS